MGYVERELEKITEALREPHSAEYDRLYAAQQALSWAIEPNGFKSPYDMITGTPGDSANCSADLRPHLDPEPESIKMIES